ncbi:class I glutamine amidotransferase-like protein [Coniophora puteana RWD-64-598 SS2]|uniref:Class I glutamine amidotransferase-like protein n=1 Tax=Coniophora puteana (strain RWD-64-598) TaxID=741705 RepID=A0A5M3MA55_CONPW|nr:class I glutamine amidotransferase-like protein [Coniophora puteana RWD-64-598 SS2]EIW76079.1 class I glutamine amidotransferase-like protein [Coniophora puteana RWD-64-598 SS2]
MPSQSSRKFKFALLLCGAPVQAVIDKKLAEGSDETIGDYSQIIPRFLYISHPDYDPERSRDEFFEVDAYDVRDPERRYPADDAQYDGLVLSGSASSAVNGKEEDWVNHLIAWTRDFADKKSTPIFGICFGHQILARAFGAQCLRYDDPGKGWELGTTTITLQGAGHKLFGQETGTLKIQQLHRDQVPGKPTSEGWEIWGYTDNTENQGMVKYRPGSSTYTTPTNIHILTVEGHPEFNKDILGPVIDSRMQNVKDPQTGELKSGPISEEEGLLGKQKMIVDAEGRKIGSLWWKMLGVEGPGTQIFSA